MKNATFPIAALMALSILASACKGQTNNASTEQAVRIVGGGCEGCEALLEYGARALKDHDTLPLFAENEPKLKITGTVFEKDGKTPAADVILYIYHTNRQGVYPTKGDETGWGRRHGFIRGWAKTGADGKYTFYTFRPGAYPGGSEPEHIHLTVKEPSTNEYYLDDYVFDDDPLLTAEERKKLSLRNRGGSGIVAPEMENGMLVARRDIVLGLNVPGYE